ncbi:MAG: molybdopterin-dependent oxidoreductase, partial [Deltaproteobacteria bacterium]|nr:molybdopterin-dependent oxidoreductase [Deltaproteobacteria bacterium]
MPVRPLHVGRRPVATTCPYCGVGCGVIATAGGDGEVIVAGDPTHPANHGRLCSKGAALAETLELDDRLLYPEIAGQRVAWEEALDTVASGLARILREHGPEAVAFYCSGQLLTEDYYVANKLMKGFIGAANIDTNSRLCMASTVVGHKRAFGSDTVPGCYEDLDTAELVVLVGSNAAWCHPILYQRLSEAAACSESRKVVVIDPRRTATCDLADLHLALRPGSDAILFNGLLTYLHAH